MVGMSVVVQAAGLAEKKAEMMVVCWVYMKVALKAGGLGRLLAGYWAGPYSLRVLVLETVLQWAVATVGKLVYSMVVELVEK
jgi:hypothetical protein